MRYQSVVLVAWVWVSIWGATGCGGEAFRESNNEGAGGTGGGSGGSGGTGGSGGVQSTSSASHNASTSSTTASTSTTGKTSCLGVSCEPAPPCAGGTLIIPEGQCCPVCSCFGAACALPVCDDRVMPIYEAGDCCPTCPEPSCAGVECRPVSACSGGNYYGRPLGACCSDCIPDPAKVACVDIVCSDPMCPPGYTSAETQGGCCYECVPDPLYCNSDSDCTIANRPRPCCGCSEVVSQRMLREDPCWYSIDDPRVIPEECYPESFCDVFCGACESPGKPACVNHRCTELR